MLIRFWQDASLMLMELWMLLPFPRIFPLVSISAVIHVSYSNAFAEVLAGYSDEIDFRGDINRETLTDICLDRMA